MMPDCQPPKLAQHASRTAFAKTLTWQVTDETALPHRTRDPHTEVKAVQAKMDNSVH